MTKVTPKDNVKAFHAAMDYISSGKSEPDPTEAVRRKMIKTGQPQKDLAATTEQTWTTEELSRDFEVRGFLAPFVVVRRKSDDAIGTLEFTHSPRVYFNFRKD